MKVSKHNNRLLIEFPTQKEMTLTMFRMSEFSEGKDGIKGKRFSCDEFIDKYSDEEGNIDYFAFWDGFNIPKSVISQFQSIFQCSERERKVIRAIKDLPEDGYVICIIEGDKMALRHELCHAKWYDDEEYREHTLSIIENMQKSLRKKLTKCLLEADYIDDVIDTEIVAYLTAFNDEDMKDIFPNIDYREIEPFVELLNNLYNGKP